MTLAEHATLRNCRTESVEAKLVCIITLVLAPNLEREAETEIDSPNRLKLLTETLDPACVWSETVICEPNLAKPRVDIEDEICTLCKILVWQVEPKFLIRPITDIEDPILTNDRTLMVDSMLHVSLIEAILPSLAYDLSEQVLPNSAKCRQEIELPNLPNDLKLSIEPNLTASRTEASEAILWNDRTDNVDAISAC
jgi:hypothetical protein